VMQRRYHAIAALLLLALPLADAALAPDSAVTRLDADLKKAPFLDAETLRQIPQQTKVSLLLRKGGWYQVELADQLRGWVRMTSLRLQPASSATTPADEIVTGRAGSRDIVASTAIRGIDESDLESASPDMPAVEHLDDYAVSADEAAAYASAIPLTPQSVDYMTPEDAAAVAIPADPVAAGDPPETRE
jgi:hypothetical protein